MPEGRHRVHGPGQRVRHGQRPGGGPADLRRADRPEDLPVRQISYDLRRLRAHQIIERIPHSRNYQLTADGLSTALFFTRLTRRVIIPALAEIAGAGPPPGSPLRQADRAYKTAIADLAAQACSSASSHDPSPSAAHLRHQW